LGIDFSSPENLVKSLPFSSNDTTAGLENEFQTVVMGSGDRVDLPRMIRNSNYYRNVIKRAQSGDNDRSLQERLRQFIENNHSQIWENSWVRLDMSCLSSYAKLVFNQDLLSDKSKPDSPRRSDAHTFFIKDDDMSLLRIPVSYLLKLSLADIIGSEPDTHSVIKVTGESLMHHFLNDNSSPEIFSFYTAQHSKGSSIGEAASGEAVKRFLLTQILTQYANKKFGLNQSGQTVFTYSAATPPVRQKMINDIIPDSFYRELFMSPCLSGWDKGEEKKQYMGLCHRVLSRSQMNAVSKLKNAGIITRNLVVLPNMSNISLANNGTHVSLGSKKLSRLLENKNSGFTAEHEKYLGDLVIKITEHFLPLFVNTYSAAPYRLSFKDFHPEKVLSFLPHELDFTHLRMIWRRWKKKASLNILGRTLTPFGPEWVDRLTSRIFGLKGDVVPDFRLIDYFACLMSSDESPALDGRPGNDTRLKKDLDDMGIFDMRMPMYLLYRMRKHSDMGFSGFEGRYYSMFDNPGEDLTHAINLQMLITALCYQYILTGQVDHLDIPDDPFTESERRQIFFGTAIGIPTFYVSMDSTNRFLSNILSHTKKSRKSNRYPRYVRVKNQEYRMGLLSMLKEDGKELIRELGLEKTMADLENRLTHHVESSVSSKLSQGIMGHISRKKKKTIKNPMKIPAEEFNSMAEDYYRNGLRTKHIQEALGQMKQDIEKMELWVTYREPVFKDVVCSILGSESPVDFLNRIKDPILNDRASEKDILAMARLLILQIYFDKKAKDDSTQTHSAPFREKSKSHLSLKTVTKG